MKPPPSMMECRVDEAAGGQLWLVTGEDLDLCLQADYDKQAFLESAADSHGNGFDARWYDVDVGDIAFCSDEYLNIEGDN